MAACSSSGLQYEVFQISAPALFGGALCAVANGTARFMACLNSTPCPWADVVIPDSPPVLPPLTMSLNNTGVVIKGGNVTIFGIKIEGASGFNNGSTAAVTSNAFSVGGSNATGGNANNKPGKPRVASFNGTLGFYTLGLVVEVLGEFEMQRSIAWAWDTTWNAWTSQVRVLGSGHGVVCFLG